MTVRRSTITQAELHEWFTYDPGSGLFRWDRKPYKSTVQIGDVAGSVNKQHGKERHVLWLKGRRIYASRAAWTYVNGNIPDTVLVDHADGDTLNDRIANLRLASATQNTWNRVQRFGSQYKLGVSKDPRGRFKTRIQLPTGEKLNLGMGLPSTGTSTVASTSRWGVVASGSIGMAAFNAHALDAA
jgi:hypothetical protein